MHVKGFSLAVALLFSSALAAAAAVDGPYYSCTPAKGLDGSKCQSHCNCGVQGKIKRPQVLETPAVSSFEACRDACLDRSDCVSFGYQASPSKCTLLSAKILGQKFKAKPSQTVFYNRHCFKCTQIPLAAPDSCNNQGVEAAVWNVDGGNYDNPTVDLTSQKGAAPDDQTEIAFVGGFYAGKYDYDDIIYGMEMEYEGYDAYFLNHRSYLYAAKKGTYTVEITEIDDVLGIWFGAPAAAGWTNDNVAARAYWEDYVDGFLQTSFQADRGAYIALRHIFYNRGGPASFSVTVKDPDGDIVTSTNDDPSKPSAYLMRFSCDGTSAPAFPSWENDA